MTKILLAAHPTTGHTNALRAIGERLLGQGHDVRMALTVIRVPFGDRWPEPMRGAIALPQKIANSGIKIYPLKPAPISLWHALLLPREKGQEELKRAIRFFTSGIKQQAQSIAKSIQEWKADIVVGDYLMPAAMLGAELAQRPYIALYHSALPFPVKDAPPFGSRLSDPSPDGKEWAEAEQKLRELSDLFDDQVSTAAHELGLSFRRKSLLVQPISTDLNLLATTPEMEPGLLPLQGPVVMTGPCLPTLKETDQNDPALAIPHDDITSVYVSLGTVFNGKPHIYDAILDGIAKQDVQAIVSAGSSLKKLSRRANPKTFLFQRVPQVALLPKVDIVVTHGGNNTVQETLIAGKPMVVIPFGGDQLANANRIEILGVGVTIHPTELNKDSMNHALQTVMQAPMIERAKAIGHSLQQYDGTKIAVDQILDLAETHKARN